MAGRRSVDAQRSGAADLVGPLPNSYYKELLSFPIEIDAKMGDIRRECRLPDGKLALAITPHVLCWWGFYELPLSQTVMFVAKVLGLAETIRAASYARNPDRTLMDLLRGDVDGELKEFESLESGTRALLIGGLLSLIYSIDAARYYSLTMDQLLARAGAGNESALRKAVSIDPLAITTRAGSSILAARTLAGNRGYGAKLMAAGVPLKRRTNRDLRFLHRVLRDMDALKGLPTEKLVDLVCGTLNLYTPYSADAGKNLKELFRRFERDTTT